MPLPRVTDSKQRGKDRNGFLAPAAATGLFILQRLHATNSSSMLRPALVLPASSSIN
jgi:hypothetical protein